MWACVSVMECCNVCIFFFFVGVKFGGMPTLLLYSMLCGFVITPVVVPFDFSGHHLSTRCVRAWEKISSAKYNSLLLSVFVY